MSKADDLYAENIALDPPFLMPLRDYAKELEDERAMLIAERDALHAERNRIAARLKILKAAIDLALEGK